MRFITVCIILIAFINILYQFLSHLDILIASELIVIKLVLVCKSNNSQYSKMQKQINDLSKHLNSCLLSQFKNYSQSLKQLSKNLYQNHNKIMNKLLLITQKNIYPLVQQILAHFMHIAELKNTSIPLIGLLTKFIQFFKYYQQKTSENKQKINKQHQNKKIEQTEFISTTLSQLINIVSLIQNKTKQNQVILRIIQTIFSLIDTHFINHMSYSMLTKVYSICFQCCSSTSIVQNISVSALFSLTQNLFNSEKKVDSLTILLNFLQYLFRSKKFGWIKESQLKGIIWDLVVVGIRNSKFQDISYYNSNQGVIQLINVMYKIAADKAFNPKKNPKTVISKKDAQKSINFKKDQISQFIRCYKAFVVFSIKFSMEFLQNQQKQKVPFKQNITMFNIIYDLERNYKMYIFLEGIFMLILSYPEFAIKQEKGYLLIEIISKISQELCLCNQKIKVNWQGEKSYLDKFYGEFNNISDGDFVRIIRNSCIQLRKKCETYEENKYNFEDKMNLSHAVDNENSERSHKEESDYNNNQQLSQAVVKKRWERFIKYVIKVIRYLSSISIFCQTDEQPVRKILLELQYWFLLSPTSKVKNLILQQLLITTSMLKSKQQAVKVSQCIQIGSNLIYGYYDLLDSVGLTIIIKMMAGIKADKQDGKQFQQLEEVFNMSEQLYLQQRIVKNEKSFQTTIQAFIQCANGLLADLQQPNNPQQKKNTNVGKSPTERYYKMIDYVMQKLNIVILQNIDYIEHEWNFLTGFWMSFCSNKNSQIQMKTINFVGQVVSKLLLQKKDKQDQILSLYLQLSKCINKKIHLNIINQVKNSLPQLQNQNAIMETFKIIKVLFENCFQQNILELSELQQAIVKEAIFRVNKIQNVKLIISSLNVLGKSKNQQYKLLTLLWAVADHMRLLSLNCKNDQFNSLWKQLFKKILRIADQSNQAQTKQCSIHTFTQILAQCTPVLKDDFLQQIFSQIYQKLFQMLICFDKKTMQILQGTLGEGHQVNHQIDMLKSANKNYFKIIKKFVLQKIINSTSFIDFSLSKLHQYISQKLANNQKIQAQNLHQYLIFLQYLSDDSLKGFYSISEVKKLYDQIGAMGQTLDKSTLMWRKKYSPLFQEIKQKYLFESYKQQKNESKQLSEKQQIEQNKIAASLTNNVGV